MDITILNELFEPVGVLDTYNSMIWTDRFIGTGDFELVVMPTPDAIELFGTTRYLQIKQSDRVMVVESFQLKSEQEGPRMYVRGRSLESILDRRVITTMTTLNSTVAAAVTTLLNQNALNPTVIERRMSQLVLESINDPLALSVMVEEQFYGDSLLDAIKMVVNSNGIGFRIRLDADRRLVFSLFSGADRSFGQFEHSVVLFAPELDNIAETSYLHSSAPFKTVAMVMGEGVGGNRVVTEAALPSGASSGLNRREVTVDVWDLSATLPSGGSLSTNAYKSLLAKRGLATLLTDCSVMGLFQGNVDPTKVSTFGIDYFLGDIVQMRDEFGLTGKARVSEFTVSVNTTGLKAYPVFETVG